MVIEEGPETRLTGLVDQHGRAITYTEPRDPIGFIWMREREDDAKGH